MDKQQIGAFSVAEMGLIKLFVSSREDATVILRNHLLQLPLVAEEVNFLSSLSQEMLQVLHRILIPELTREVPVTLQATMFSRLTFIEQYSEEGAYLHIRVNDLIIQYFEQQFGRIVKPNEEGGILLKVLPLHGGILTTLDEKQARVMGVLAFNKIIPLVEERVLRIKIMGEPPKEESPEEIVKKNKKNSSR